MSSITTNSRLTLRDLNALYEKGEKLTMLTAYDVMTASLLDAAGTEMILVGDSLGNVVLGYETTLSVTLEDMIRHTAAVVRGSSRALVICDLPFGSTITTEETLRASVRALRESGCQAVKLEGGAQRAETVRRLTEEGIPVVGHIGLTPQSIHQLGGFFRHGKTAETAARLKEAALALEAAGAFAVVLECVVPEVAAEITRALHIPTIGIGSGDHCSGQVLVINDLVGMTRGQAPQFAKRYARHGVNVGAEIQRAVELYIKDVKAGPNPGLATSVATSTPGNSKNDEAARS